MSFGEVKAGWGDLLGELGVLTKPPPSSACWRGSGIGEPPSVFPSCLFFLLSSSLGFALCPKPPNTDFSGTTGKSILSCGTPHQSPLTPLRSMLPFSPPKSPLPPGDPQNKDRHPDWQHHRDDFQPSLALPPPVLGARSAGCRDAGKNSSCSSSTCGGGCRPASPRPPRVTGPGTGARLPSEETAAAPCAAPRPFLEALFSPPPPPLPSNVMGPHIFQDKVSWGSLALQPVPPPSGTDPVNASPPRRAGCSVLGDCLLCKGAASFGLGQCSCVLPSADTSRKYCSDRKTQLHLWGKNCSMMFKGTFPSLPEDAVLCL